LCFSILEAIPLISTPPYLVNYYTELTPDSEHKDITSNFSSLCNKEYIGIPIETFCVCGGIIAPLGGDIFFDLNYPYMPLTKDMYNYFFKNRDEALEKLIIKKYIIINLILEKKEQNE